MKGLLYLESKILFNSNINISKLGMFLLLFCMLDALFTDLGIRNNLITETNPLMDWIYENSVLGFYALKISMAVLLVYILSRIQPTLLIKMLMIGAISIYSAILFMHIFWIVIVFL